MGNIYIDGIGTVQLGQVEYTTSVVVDPYLTAMTTLQQVLLKNPDTLTTTDTTNLYNAIDQLKSLVPGVYDPSLGQTFYLTPAMAVDLGRALKSLASVGLPDMSATDSANIQLIKNWQGLANFGVADVFTNAIGSAGTAFRTLQSLIELEYVKQGNDYIANHLVALEKQIETTQQILSNLTIVQNVINQVTVVPAAGFNFPPTLTSQIPSAAYALLKTSTIIGTLSIGGQTYTLTDCLATDAANARSIMTQHPDMTYLSALAKTQNYAAQCITNSVKDSVPNFLGVYKICASANFTQVFPTPTPTADAANSLLTAYQKLKDQLTNLESQSSQDRNVQNSLANFINQVVQDISAKMISPFPAGITDAQKTAAVSAYIMDNQNQKLSTSSGFQAGAIQSHLTNAISSTESLNDRQKADVNNYQFVFQQFYQSAADVLSKVTQVVESLAQAIAKQ